MPQTCQVCASPLRAQIDEQLAQQRVNISAMARATGLHVKSLRRHRDKHLPMFLASFVASSVLPDVSQLVAEYQRLYATALDVLATAERGVLIGQTDDGKEIREVSLSAQLKAVREARSTLDRLTTLAVARESGAQTAEPGDTELAARIAAALDRLAERARVGTGHDIADATVIDADATEGARVTEPLALGAPNTTPRAGRQADATNGSPLTPEM